MISEISIQNFKSVEKLTLPLGRVNVLIGENGAGKSNILEAIALMSAAASEKLDAEFLFTRGVRIVTSRLMCSAFASRNISDQDIQSITLKAHGDVNSHFDFRLCPYTTEDTDVTPNWFNLPAPTDDEAVSLVYRESQESERQLYQEALHSSMQELSKRDDSLKNIESFIQSNLEDIVGRAIYLQRIATLNQEADKHLGLSNFLIYSPENSALRRFEEEGQIQPVGIRGEGLFKMLQTFGRDDYADRLVELKESLELIGWFLNFRVPANLAPGESRLQIIDRFLGNNVPLDQRSANEGFLFLLFYFAVFLSKSTPAFFAIDNVDASLNPRLCAELMRRLVELAVKYDKQVILTTHNPAILDGLNLTDDDQRLFSIYRTHEGRTRARRIDPPRPQPDELPVRLSEAFLRGLLGGVPKNF